MKKRLAILIVEDNPNVLDCLRLFADSLLGMQVICASSFLPAIELIKRATQLDLLLCDVLLPGEMTGIDVAEVAVATHPDIAVVMFSADPQEDIEGLSDRYSFAQKPFGREMITHHIDEAFLKLKPRALVPALGAA